VRRRRVILSSVTDPLLDQSNSNCDCHSFVDCYQCGRRTFKGFRPNLWKLSVEKTRTSPQAQIKCDCGIQVNDSPMALARHLKSVFHNNANRIRGWLDQDELSFVEISRRVGISAERIRQISREFGKTGRQRLAHNRLTEKNRRLYSAPLIKKTAEICQRLDLAFEPIGQHAAIINGHHCLIYPCWEATKDNHKYFRIRAPKRMDGDYLILWIRNLAFIFPKRKVAKETFFTIYPLPTGPKKARHDYTNFLDAWSQLSMPKR